MLLYNDALALSGITLQPASLLCIANRFTVEPLSTDTPKMRPSTVMRTYWAVPNDIPLTYILIISLNADTSLFRKADTFFGPTSVVTVQNVLDNAGVCLIDNINSTFL